MGSKNLSKPRVILLGDAKALESAYPESLLGEIQDAVEILPTVLTKENWSNHADLLASADFIFATWGVPRLDFDFLSKAPNLKAFFYAAGSVKGFVTQEFFAREIVLCNANRANAIPVAEFAVSAIILSLKQFWQHAAHTRRLHEWKRLSVRGAYRATVGLVSLGAVGRLTAEKLRSYELDVQAYDPFATQESAGALGVRLVSLDEIFSGSDVVSLHAPWLPETENMIDGRLLRMMRSGATLLNTSRGAIIREMELYDVLRERPDLTAVLDVTYPEPPRPDSPLYDLQNVVLTPHISGSMGGEISRMGRWMIDELLRYLNGEPLQHVLTEQMLATAA